MNDRRDFLRFCGTSVALLGAGNAVAQTSPLQYLYDQNMNYPKEETSQQNLNQVLPQYQNDFWNQPRQIFIKRAQTGESAKLFYHANGQINQEHYWMASYLLRDVNQKQMVYVDTTLLDLMCAVQAWLGHFGFTNPIVVTSGFRSAKTNSSLEGAAKNSMHLKGKAVDFTVPGLNVRDVAKIAKHFQAGGVGIYPSRSFIHLDTGRVRSWVAK